MINGYIITEVKMTIKIAMSNSNRMCTFHSNKDQKHYNVLK